MKENSLIRVLTNKNFLRIWIPHNLSLISAMCLNFILIGKIHSLTHSSVAVGFFIFFYYLPTALLGLFVGVLIDNWSKKSIFIYSNLIQSVIVLFYLGIHEKVWPVYLLVFLYSLGDEFYNPAVGASIPAVVEKKYLPVANSFFFFTIQGSTIAGMVLGGLMLKFLTNQNLIFIIISSLLLLAVAISLSLPAKPFKGTKKLKINPIDPLNLSQTFDLAGFWEQTKEGYRFIKGEPLVFFPLILLAGLQTLIGVFMVIFPSLAEILKIEYADSAFFIVIPMLLGIMVGGTIISKMVKKVRKNIFILSGLYALGICIIIISLISLIFGQPIFFAIPVISALGIGYVLIYVPLQTLIQENTPFDVRGRVFGAFSTLLTLAAILPMLITTTLVDLLGIRLILIAIGVGILFLGAFAQKNKEAILNTNR